MKIGFILLAVLLGLTACVQSESTLYDCPDSGNAGQTNGASNNGCQVAGSGGVSGAVTGNIDTSDSNTGATDANASTTDSDTGTTDTGTSTTDTNTSTTDTDTSTTDTDTSTTDTDSSTTDSDTGTTDSDTSTTDTDTGTMDPEDSTASTGDTPTNPLPDSFTTPEAFLADERVITWLDDMQAKGYTLNPSLDTSPPNISGIYKVTEFATGQLVTSDGLDFSTQLTGAEIRLTVDENLVANQASVFTLLGQPTSYYVSAGDFIRGNGNSFTKYGAETDECSVNGAVFKRSYIQLLVAEIDPATGDMLQVTTAEMTTSLSGTPPANCPPLLPSLSVVGGWAMTVADRRASSTTDSLVHMCVDEANAYVPTERWVRGNGENCQCSQNYIVECGL